MNIAIPDRYQLVADFEKRAISFSFPAEVWNVALELSEVSKPTSPSELEKLTGQSSAQVLEALERLLTKKLVRQELITWKEFTDSKEEFRSAIKTAAETVTPPEKQVVPTPAVAAKPDQENVSLRLGSITPQTPTGSVGSNAWVWQKPPTTQVVAASKPEIHAAQPRSEASNERLLRPMLEQIENHKGGGVEGQLLVYQVFLHVPYQLLRDEGIKSLHFVNERTVIKNPNLHAAIVKAAKDVAGVELV